MKKLCVLLLFASLSAVALAAQTGTCSMGVAPVCTDDQTIAVSGHAVTIQSNGGQNVSIEEVVSGSPSTVSIVAQACGKAGTCSTVDTNTAVGGAIRSITLANVTNYLTVTASWTGGTGVAVRTVTMISTTPSVATVSVSNFPGTQPVSGSVTGSQGSPNTVANSWPIELTNGASVTAVKAASTAAAAADPSAVVALSPNTPLPAGTNAIGALGPSTSANSALSSADQASLTTAVVVKSSGGNLYGVYALNGAASTCWIQFLNASSSPALGTAVILSIPLPASTTQPLWIGPGDVALANFTTGISVGIATTAAGSTACGTAGNVVVEYK